MESADTLDITLTPCQQQAMDNLKNFIENERDQIFILKGYAGTGKTTMLRLFIDELRQRNLKFKLLASTGRAAKIVNNITSCKTKTVHGLIYTFNELNQDIQKIVDERSTTGVDKSGQLLLNFDLVTVNPEDSNNNFYIIDEASMVSDKTEVDAAQAIFGSGKLLTDLLSYDKKGKFIFVGDECQLPPVSQDFSPALSDDYFSKTYSYNVNQAILTEIIRQKSDNDLIVASKRIRDLYNNPPNIKWAKFPFKGYRNIKIYSDQASLLKAYIDNISKNGYNNSTLICFSNKQCNTLTSIIRPMMGLYGNLIQKNDLLLVTQNNYISGLMNGDLVAVEEVGIREKRAGLTFLKISVRDLFSNEVYSQFIIENVLYNNQINLTQVEQKELFIDYFIRMKEKGIKQNSVTFKKNMFIDPYLNALRAVYGFALTCHKSQGGEWDHVYLDISKSVPAIEKPYVYQWIYTAMTRAKVQLHLVDNWWLT